MTCVPWNDGYIDTPTLYILSDIVNEIGNNCVHGTMEIDPLTREACNPLIYTHTGLLKCPSNAEPRWGALGQPVMYFWVYGREFTYTTDGFPEVEDVKRAAFYLSSIPHHISACLAITNHGMYLFRVDASMVKKAALYQYEFVESIAREAENFVQCPCKTPAAYQAKFKSCGLSVRLFKKSVLDKKRILSTRRRDKTTDEQSIEPAQSNDWDTQSMESVESACSADIDNSTMQNIPEVIAAVPPTRTQIRHLLTQSNPHVASVFTPAHIDFIIEFCYCIGHASVGSLPELHSWIHNTRSQLPD